MEQESAQPMPWVSQVLAGMSWQGADTSGGSSEANAKLSSQRYNTLGEEGSELPKGDGGRGMVMDAVTPATHAPPAAEAGDAAEEGAGSSGVPSNDESQVTQPGGAERLPRQ